MNLPFWIHILALLFSFFVIGAVLGTVLIDATKHGVDAAPGPEDTKN